MDRIHPIEEGGRRGRKRGGQVQAEEANVRVKVEFEEEEGGEEEGVNEQEIDRQKIKIAIKAEEEGDEEESGQEERHTFGNDDLRTAVRE